MCGDIFPTRFGPLIEQCTVQTMFVKPFMITVDPSWKHGSMVQSDGGGVICGDITLPPSGFTVDPCYHVV